MGSPDRATVSIVSDASGHWGCGAFYSNQWLQLQWPASWTDVSIAPKELAPIVLAAAVWGHGWRGTRVSFSSDNDAVVAVLKKGTAKDARLLRLLQCLSFFAAIFQFAFTAKHIPGKHNQAISRGKFDLFFSIHPQTRREPVQIPQPLYTGSSGGSITQLELVTLDATVNRYFATGIAASTGRVYNTAKRRCFLLRKGTPLLATGRVLTRAHYACLQCTSHHRV